MPSQAPVTAYRGTLLHFVSDPGEGDNAHAAQFFDDGLLVVNNGYVSAADNAASLLPTLTDKAQVVDCSGSLIVPGFVPLASIVPTESV